jgi:hypothetical protein
MLNPVAEEVQTDAQRAWVQFSKAVEPVPSRRAYFRFARAVECANLRARDRKRSLPCGPSGARQETIKEMRRRYTASIVRQHRMADASRFLRTKSSPQKSRLDERPVWIEISPNDENKPGSPLPEGNSICQTSQQLLSSTSAEEPWVSWRELVYIGAPAFVLGLALIGVTIIAVVDY